MTSAQIRKYLINDLKVSLANDVKPTVRPRSMEGGYFSVPRLVLSYVDFLGALYNGYNGKIVRGRRILARASYAKRFLKEVFGRIDVNYRIYGDLLWEVYRNGTVHLYEPMKLSNRGQVIGWMVYKGARRKLLPIGQKPRYVVHLVPFKMGKFWVQPVSITCLYKDLIRAVEEYSKMIGRSSKLRVNFRQAANALKIPEPTHLVWW